MTQKLFILKERLKLLNMFPTGKILAEKRLIDLKIWQELAHKALKSDIAATLSRQVRRRKRLKWDKRRSAEARFLEIKSRRKSKKRVNI